MIVGFLTLKLNQSLCILHQCSIAFSWIFALQLWIEHRHNTRPVKQLWSTQANYIIPAKTLSKQEAFEKCWAHSPLRAAVTLPFTRCRYYRTPAIAIMQAACDIHDNDDNDDNDNDDNNDNAWQRGLLLPNGMCTCAQVCACEAAGPTLFMCAL